MDTENKCHYLNCRRMKGEKTTFIYCKCCNITFCGDTCLVEHLILKEKKKSTKIDQSIFMKSGTLLKEPEKNTYYDFSNFDKVKSGTKTQVLGSGAFGEVYLAKHKLDGKLFAVKQISKAKLTSVSIKPDMIYREISIHTRLVHDHIARLYSYHEDNKYFYLIIEYVENGTLFSIIQKSNGLSEEDSFKYFIQVASALNFLHEHNMIHRDLKPENVLLDNKGNIKLCDFGWTVETSKKRETFCGTYEYMAPEIIVEKPYDNSIDIWSLGVLLYELLHSYSPFRAKKSDFIYSKNEDYSYKEVMKNVLNFKFKIEKKVSDECKDLLIKLLNPKTENRISIASVFSHPWVRNYENRIKQNCIQIERDMKRYNTYKDKKISSNLSNTRTKEIEGNVTILDPLQNVKNSSKKEVELFDDVLEKVQAKSKHGRRRSSSVVNYRFSPIKENKIVLRAVKPEKEGDNSLNKNSNIFEMSPIKKNLVNFVDESCFSMYKEMREIDQEIDRKIDEKSKQFEDLKKKTEKMKEKINQSSNKNGNNYLNSFRTYTEEDNEDSNKKTNFTDKFFENLKTQPQSLIQNTSGQDSYQMPHSKIKSKLTNNYNDLHSYSKNIIRHKKNSHTKKNLKEINRELEIMCSSNQLNYSGGLDIDNSTNITKNHLLNDHSKIPFRFNNKREISIQTDTPTSNSIWSKFFGFFGTFKCGS